MARNQAIVKARIPIDVRDEAQEALEAMGLDTSSFIRMAMTRVAKEKRIPFDVRVPNQATRQAMAELEAGKGTRVANVAALMADLHAESD